MKSKSFSSRFLVYILTLVVVISSLYVAISFDATYALVARIAHAATSFNTDPQDFATVRSSNFTRFPGSTNNWAAVTDADAGEVVSFTVYYHNTGSEDAQNVRAHIDIPQGDSTSITAQGFLSADNVLEINGQTTINISSSQHLTYIPGSTKWYPNQSVTAQQLPFGQTGDEFVTAQGLNIGDIAPGWSSQGSIVAQFTVSNTTTPPPAVPTVDLKVKNSDGPVTLNLGEDLDLNWVSQNALNCSITSPFTSGVGTMGSATFSPAHPDYPTASGKTYTIVCDNGLGVIATDSVVVYGPAPLVSTVDIMANNSQGPVTLSQNEALVLNWISSNVSSCSIGSPVDSGVSDNGSAGPINPGHPFYPLVGTSVTFTITCLTGNNGSVTDSVTVIVPPSVQVPQAPTLSAATSLQCGGKIDLAWNAVSTATSYKVFRDGNLVATTSAVTYVDTVIPSSSHSYTVRAVNSVGDSVDSNTVIVASSGVCVVAPNAPTITGITSPRCGGYIDLMWNAVSNASYYKVYRDGNLIGTTSSVTFSDQVSPDSQHAYTVKSANSAGYSQFSNQINVTASSACITIPSAPVITAVTSMQCGGKVDISWSTVATATSYKIFRDGNLVGTITATTFTDIVTPSTSHAYSVKAVNSAGDSSASNIVTVISSVVCVVPPSAPTLSASTSVQCGGAIDLSWNAVANATSYKVFRDGNLIGTTTAITFVDTVTASSTHSYTVKAVNSVGMSNYSNIVTATASAACPVTPTPTVQISANPQTIYQGQNSTLTWSSTNTTACSGSWKVGTSTSGTQVVNPNSTTIYGITCVGNGGSASASTTIQVVVVPPSPACRVTLTNPLTATGKIGQQFTFTLTATTSTSTISYTATGIPAGLSLSGSTISGIPTVSGTFSVSITANNGCSTDTETLVISIGQKDEGGGGGSHNPSVSIAANPQTIYKGQNSTLTWTSHDVSACSATWTTATSTSGTKVVSPATSTSYAILCTGSYGSASATTTVTVLPALVPAVTLTANPASIQLGATSTLSWSSTNATTCSAPWTTATSTAGSFVVTPTSTTSYSIQCTNGSTTASSSVIVTVTNPPAPVPTVTLTANPSTIQNGQSSTLTWNSSNVTSCAAPWTSATSTNGSQVVTPSSTTAYSITCVGQYGNATSSVTVIVTTSGGGGENNPTVTLTANPASIQLGATSTLSWSSTNATTCSAPWTTATSTAGSFVVTPTSTTSYSIQCTNGSTTASSSVIVTVTNPPAPVPTVTLTANPSTINFGSSSTLSWSSTNVSFCAAPWTTATSTTGSLVVAPGVTTTYNIACGGLYGTSTASVNVTVVPVTPVVTPPTSGGGGGGTAPRSGTRHGISTSQVLGESLSCDYLKDYLRIGWSNDRTEVIKLQIFLRELEGFKNLSITGVFDIDTFNAVSTFQERYPEAILTPWGYKVNEPTGFVYILTKKKVNEIVCQRAFPLNTLQETEIQEFKSFLESLKSKGVIVPELQTVQVTRPVTLTNTPVSTTTVGSNHLDLKPLTGVSNEKIEDNTKVTKNGFFSRIAGLFSNNAVNREAAGAVFAGPQGWEESLNSIVVFFTILLGLYLIVTMIVERQMKKRSLTLDSQKIRKMFMFILGLLVSAVIAFAVRFYSIVLPLVVLMIILSVSLLWFTLKPKEVRTIITIDKP